MKRVKKPQYDSECFYGNKSVGKCTLSDGQAFTLMLETCNNSPKEALTKYSYFSSELKEMLEKAALIEEKNSK